MSRAGLGGFGELHGGQSPGDGNLGAIGEIHEWPPPDNVHAAGDGSLGVIRPAAELTGQVHGRLQGTRGSVSRVLTSNLDLACGNGKLLSLRSRIGSRKSPPSSGHCDGRFHPCSRSLVGSEQLLAVAQLQPARG